MDNSQGLLFSYPICMDQKAYKQNKQHKRRVYSSFEQERKGKKPCPFLLSIISVSSHPLVLNSYSRLLGNIMMPSLHAANTKERKKDLVLNIHNQRTLNLRFPLITASSLQLSILRTLKPDPRMSTLTRVDFFAVW